ncbi:MAG: hypothetical protein ACLT3Y_00395 [Ruminococcus callidus]
MKEKKFFMRIAAAVSSAVVMLASVPAGYAMVSFAEETLQPERKAVFLKRQMMQHSRKR